MLKLYYSLKLFFSRKLTGTRINGRVFECISTDYSLPVVVLQWLLRFCSPLGMAPKSGTKLNWHIIPFCTIWYNKGRSKRKRSFRNSLEIYEFPASLGVYRAVIISKTPIISNAKRAENFRKLRFRNLRISKCFRSTSLCFPRAGRRAPDYAVPTSRLL